MRGFGITAVDFAIECHMDRIAEVTGVDPIELRIRNAYRDGDMKAHRRVAKNTALIECCQVVAGKAGWPLSAEAAAQSSLRGGGTPERVAIPETVTDREGRIGDRRAGRVADTAPSKRPTGRVAAGAHFAAVSGAPVQNPDMQIEAERIGHRMGSSTAAPGPQPARPAGPASAAPPRAAAATPAASYQAPVYRPPAAPAPTAPQASSHPPAAPPSPAAQPAAPTASPPAPAERPYAPDKPFSRGTRRPGTSPFLSGTRRR
jgi:hypothetical protein